jgi:hypothetical protein
VSREPWVVADLLQQLLCLPRERNWVARLLRVDAPVRAVVGVDQVVGVLPEPEPELDVPPRGTQRSEALLAMPI